MGVDQRLPTKQHQEPFAAAASAVGVSCDREQGCTGEEEICPAAVRSVCFGIHKCVKIFCSQNFDILGFI